MTIVAHELRQGKTVFAVWTAAIAFLLAVCVFIFPEMGGNVDTAGDMFASMGNFTAAFGMDRLDIGTLIGFYAVECGTILGLGGAFFASLTGVSALAKEEKGRTAEFLLTHPVSRARIVSEKLGAALIQITVMNAAIFGLALLSIKGIGEEIPWKGVLLLHGACYLLQLEMAGICFGISAFLRRGGVGAGIGIASAMYVLNLIANMTEGARFLKYITPFGYCEGADIIAHGKMNAGAAAAGMLFACLGVAAAYWRYLGKDIR